MASNSTLTVVFALMLLMVYWLLLTDTVEPLTFTLLIRYPLSGVNVILADVPSFTVNEVVLPRIVVLLYVAEPLPDAAIDKV